MATSQSVPMHLGASLPTVLVVEDDAANRVLLTRLLERAGYRAVTADDGPSGLAAAFEVAPDLVLLDIGLPGMDGLEICRRLRADPRTVALPVVLLTGRTSVEDVVAGLDAGADDFLAKPFHEAELLARMRSARRLALVMAEMEGAQGVVAALANAVEAKDSMTEDHCQRLAGLAHVLATAGGVEPATIKGIVIGALLHDIGKIGVSDLILRKPGLLTEEEWLEMRRHPLIGEQICRPLQSSREFAPIVRHHHERWDGAGYPDRLQGDEIPVGARIVSLVDAFDAMIHDRPYRAARPLESAMATLAAGAGHQFDPELVERFAAIVERDGVIESSVRLRVDSLAALRASSLS
jgi:putative two-component system response regulator